MVWITRVRRAHSAGQCEPAAMLTDLDRPHGRMRRRGFIVQRITIHEFSKDAGRYLAGDNAVVVEQDGETVGYYVPIAARGRQNESDAFDRLEKTVQRVLAETGLTEEELSRLFDLSEPIPDGSGRPRTADAQLSTRLRR
jgi:hypothetical protein